MFPGTLYVVATPIGNMQDITLRALEILKSVDLIVSEDTRQTTKVLNHFNISKKQVSYRDENHHKVSPMLLELLKGGADLALVSDSGTPLISDPGFKLVELALANKVKMVPIPGASAVSAALSVCGLPSDKFVFIGFLPKRQAQKEALLKKYCFLDATCIIFESKFRVLKTLQTVLDTVGDRKVCIAREMTKVYEEFMLDSLSNLITQLTGKSLKGEFVILVAKEGF